MHATTKGELNINFLAWLGLTNSNFIPGVRETILKIPVVARKLSRRYIYSPHTAHNSSSDFVS